MEVVLHCKERSLFQVFKRIDRNFCESGSFMILSSSLCENQKEKTSNNFLKSSLSAERQSCSGEEEEELQSIVFESKCRKMESKVKGKQSKRLTDYGYLTVLSCLLVFVIQTVLQSHSYYRVKWLILPRDLSHFTRWYEAYCKAIRNDILSVW